MEDRQNGCSNPNHERQSEMITIAKVIQHIEASIRACKLPVKLTVDEGPQPPDGMFEVIPISVRISFSFDGETANVVMLVSPERRWNHKTREELKKECLRAAYMVVSMVNEENEAKKKKKMAQNN